MTTESVLGGYGTSVSAASPKDAPAKDAYGDVLDWINQQVASGNVALVEHLKEFATQLSSIVAKRVEAGDLTQTANLIDGEGYEMPFSSKRSYLAMVAEVLSFIEDILP